ncbi:MAG: sugar transferase [Deltaproteobacteria bacterium]|nr:sugar transferase [Deltaproteobacteria bacterium]
MIKQRNILLKAYKLFDVSIMVFSFALATWITNPQLNGLDSLGEFLSVRIKLINFFLFLGMMLFWYIILNSFSLYKHKRLTSRWKELFDIGKATILGTFLIFITAELFSIEVIHRSFIIIFWILSCSLMIASHLIIRWFLEWIRRRGRNIRYMLIVGTNSRAVDFAKKIESQPELGYRIAGFVDGVWQGIPDFQKSGYKIVTDFKNFPSYLREEVVDEVVISLPVKSQYKNASKIAAQAQEQGITVWQLPDIFDLKTSKMRAGSIEGVPLISSYKGEMHGWQINIKRSADIILSGLGILILLPVYFISAAAIKLSSPGPIFFVQKRLGINKRKFKMIKFRTMIPDAEEKQDELEGLNETDGPVFKIKKDPRITPIGKILRKLSIDELPQLFNVFKGDMSLVGPRPLPIRDYNGFSEDWHRRRFSVRPGITCLWQVNGRCNTSFQKWMKMDMEYIDNWSLWLDFKILVQTVPAVLKGSGAV